VNETKVTAEQIREEHQPRIHPLAHLAYLGLVLLGGLSMMIVVMAIIERLA
jgi:hypothetical protein